MKISKIFLSFMILLYVALRLGGRVERIPFGHGAVLEYAACVLLRYFTIGFDACEEVPAE